MNVNRLIEFAKQNAISIHIHFWEASGEFEIETTSAAPAECFYMKRCHDEEYFIKAWGKHVMENVSK